MSEQKFRSLRSVLVYLRLKGYSQSAAKKELKDVLGEDVSLAWIKKWWGNDIDQLDGKQGEGGGREPRSAATRQIIKRSNPASSLSEVAREVEKGAGEGSVAVCTGSPCRRMRKSLGKR